MTVYTPGEFLAINGTFIEDDEVLDKLNSRFIDKESSDFLNAKVYGLDLDTVKQMIDFFNKNGIDPSDPMFRIRIQHKCIMEKF